MDFFIALRWLYHFMSGFTSQMLPFKAFSLFKQKFNSHTQVTIKSSEQNLESCQKNSQKTEFLLSKAKPFLGSAYSNSHDIPLSIANWRITM